MKASFTIEQLTDNIYKISESFAQLRGWFALIDKQGITNELEFNVHYCKYHKNDIFYYSISTYDGYVTFGDKPLDNRINFEVFIVNDKLIVTAI